MATIVETTAAPKESFLSKLGGDVKKVFAWLGNPKVQQAVVAGEALGEGVVDIVDPALAGINPLINNWTQEIFKAQALAAAAGAQAGSGAQKAAMVLSSVTPQVVQFAQQNGMEPLTGTDLVTANNLLVQFLQLFTAKTATAAATPAS